MISLLRIQPKLTANDYVRASISQKLSFFIPNTLQINLQKAQR